MTVRLEVAFLVRLDDPLSETTLAQRSMRVPVDLEASDIDGDPTPAALLQAATRKALAASPPFEGWDPDA